MLHHEINDAEINDGFNEIPEIFRVTKKGEQFLQYDSGPKVNRLIFFSLRHRWTGWKKADVIEFDGTFKTSPNIFAQIFSIHVFMKSRCVAAVVALMSGQDEACYTQLFKQNKVLCPELNPSLIICNFAECVRNGIS